MTGLFFSLKVTSAYMIFGKSSGVPAGLPCVRQSQDTHTHKKYPWLRRNVIKLRTRPNGLVLNLMTFLYFAARFS